MQTIVGVLRGGSSREHETSLASGAFIISNLPKERFATHDLYIDKQGQWYDRGHLTTPEKALRQIDIALIGLHGEYANREVQKYLEIFGVPYVGSNSFNSYSASHKLIAKINARDAGVLTPKFLHIEHREDSENIVRDAIRTFAQPSVVKSVGRGASSVSFIVGGYVPILSAVNKLFNEGAQGVIIEEYIRGKGAVVGIVEKLRDEDLYALPAIEIPSGANKFSRVDEEELRLLAKTMHSTLAQRHYSQSSFVVAPKGIYYIGTNSFPEITRTSSIMQSLDMVGIPAQDFMVHLVNTVLK